MIKIIAIDYFSANKDEAIVQIADANYSCLAYCSKCSFQEGAIIIRPLYALLVENICLSEDELCFYQTKEKFEGEIVATIIDIQKHYVQIGEIIIEIDGDFPGDIKVGDRVRFVFARLDLNQY